MYCHIFLWITVYIDRHYSFWSYNAIAGDRRVFITLINNSIIIVMLWQGIDAFLHVNPWLREKGLMMVFNPTLEPVSDTLTVPLYYTGLTNTTLVSEQGAAYTSYTLDRQYNIYIPITLGPLNITWFLFLWLFITWTAMWRNPPECLYAFSFCLIDLSFPSCFRSFSVPNPCDNSPSSPVELSELWWSSGKDKRENYQNCSVLCCVWQLYTVICTHTWAVLKVEYNLV